MSIAPCATTARPARRLSKRRGTRPELRLRLGVAAFLWMLGLGAWAQFFTEPAQETARPTVERLEHEFYFTRGIYTSGDRDEWVPRWAVDYPKADQQFLVALRRLTAVDAFDSEHALALYGDELGDFPFVYALEVGSLNLDEQQALALRRYLLSGGFLVIDDFWGSWDWEHFKAQMLRVFPEHEIVEVPLEHPVFHAFYDIADILQVPNVRQADGGPTHELDGIVPHVRGIFDDKGRLMVLINWNTDLGDAWEWADLPQYPLRYSTYAYEMGINFVIYAMTH